MPRAICLALVALGLVLLARGLATRRTATEIVLPTPRVLVLILGAAALFALTGQLGLVVTVALACIAATLAAPGFRTVESIVFGVGLALFSYLLFVLLLRQGLPVWPQLAS
jgi:hypothetical protein